MAFSLKPAQSVRKNLRRLAGRQIEKALGSLADTSDMDKAVHEVRKCCKRLRALLRLVRPHVAEDAYQRENTRFRDAARPLSEVRDAAVLVETLDKLREDFPDPPSAEAIGDIRKELVARKQKVQTHVQDEQNALAAVIDAFRQAQERVSAWTGVADRWRSLGDGVQAVYQKARAAFVTAADDPTVDNLHEWRKQTKYLRHHMEILTPLWPEMIGDVAEQSDRLGEFLGEDHDLAVLRQFLTDQSDRFGGMSALDGLLGLVEQRRRQLLRDELLRGERLYQERPRNFNQRLRGYWRGWRDATQHQLPHRVAAAIA